jgi:hypothetical protein
MPVSTAGLWRILIAASRRFPSMTTYLPSLSGDLMMPIHRIQTAIFDYAFGKRD